MLCNSGQVEQMMQPKSRFPWTCDPALEPHGIPSPQSTQVNPYATAVFICSFWAGGGLRLCSCWYQSPISSRLRVFLDAYTKRRARAKGIRASAILYDQHKRYSQPRKGLSRRHMIFGSKFSDCSFAILLCILSRTRWSGRIGFLVVAKAPV